MSPLPAKSANCSVSCPSIASTGPAGGDSTCQRNFARAYSLAVFAPFLDVFRRDLDGAALVEHPPQVAAGFERLDVLVNRGERSQLQALRQFLVAGAVAVLFHEIRDEVENLFLPLGKSHRSIVGEEKENVK